MKSFKGYLAEKASGEQAKAFEVDIVNLINYCVKNKVSPEEGVTNIEIKGSASAEVLSKTVKNVYKDGVTTGAKTEKQHYSLKSNYDGGGMNQAKADIIIIEGNRWMPTSVKLSGSMVIASTQNKDEFNGIFMSAVNRYEKNEGGKINEKIIEIIDRVKKTAISEVYSRDKLTDKGGDYSTEKTGIGSFKRSLDKAFTSSGKKSKTVDINKILEDMRKIEVKNGYGVIEESIKQLKTELQASLNTNKLLKQYITFEGMTAYNKYNSKGEAPADNKEFENDKEPSRSAPYASYVLSPDGFDEIKSPRSPYVVAATNVSTPNIRTLPTGAARSGDSTLRLTTQLISGNKTEREVFDSISKVAVNLKYDSNTKAIHKELLRIKQEIKDAQEILKRPTADKARKKKARETLKSYNITEVNTEISQGMLLEEVLVEFKFGGFFAKIRQGFATIGKGIKGMVSSLLSKVVDGVGNFFDVLKKKPASEMIDGLGLGISGTIKLP